MPERRNARNARNGECHNGNASNAATRARNGGCQNAGTGCVCGASVDGDNDGVSTEPNIAENREELPEVADGPFFCDSCRRRYGVEAYECPSCEDEPLLDLRDPEVEHMLRGFDERDWRKRAALFTVVAIVVCLPLLMLVLLHTTFGAAVYVLGVLGLSGALIKRFPPARRVPTA